ncbi:MAG TPA: hypothetical protein DCS93_08720 [Microscillaceae bacterium]|nr:hypothetical protein [Microscillaceae bacterium]
MSKLTFNPLNTIIAVAILYGVLLSLNLLYTNRKQRNAQFWLGLYLMIFSLELLDTYLKDIHLERLYPFINWTYYRILTLIPVLLWVYIAKLVHKPLRLGIKEIICVGIVLLDFLDQVFAFFLKLLKQEKLFRLNRRFIDDWLDLIGIVVTIIVLIDGIRLLNQYGKKLQNNYASQEERKFKWLKEVLIVLGVMIVAWFVAMPLNIYLYQRKISFYWIWIPQAIYIFYFGIKGLQHPEIVHDFSLVTAFDQSLRQASSSKQDEKAHVSALIKLMEEEKVYRHPKLTVYQLAKMMNLPSKKVSYLINSHLQCSFSDFINKYRVEEIKQRIQQQDTQKLTLLALAQEAGFSSKSSFNFMFKKFTGVAPNTYKKKYSK